MSKQPKLNIKRILEMAALLETLPEGCGFNMRSWGGLDSLDYKGEPCGTVACIAGWTLCRYGPSGRAKTLNPGRVNEFYTHNDELSDFSFDIKEAARRILGLDKVSATELFIPSGLRIRGEVITPKMAATVLRNLAETGEVDWYKDYENEQTTKAKHQTYP